MRPVPNTYLWHVPDIKAQEMGLPEINVRVGTGFPEALEAETLAACSSGLFTQHGELFDNISLRLCLDHVQKTVWKAMPDSSAIKYILQMLQQIR